MGRRVGGNISKYGGLYGMLVLWVGSGGGIGSTKVTKGYRKKTNLVLKGSFAP